jgi:hypothetical protein
MLAIYPIFNLKGFKYNPDLLQLITLPLVMLAYLDAFDKRTIRSGIWLGLAGALALMTKYWVLTMIGAIGLAALIHPARMLFLRSPAPWVAIATLVVAMVPHFIWLKQVDFAPFRYPTDTYSISNHIQGLELVLVYIGHNIALLALPLVVAAVALAWSPHAWMLLQRDPRAFVTQPWSRDANSDVRMHQARNIWIVQGIVAAGSGRDSSIAPAPGRASASRCDLAGDFASCAGRCAADRSHHAAQCDRPVHLWLTFGARA